MWFARKRSGVAGWPADVKRAVPVVDRATRVGAMTLLALSACQSGVSAPARSDAPTADITALIGDAACTADSQCRTIGLGSKPCGGFERYVAWSTLRTDAEALRRAIEPQRTQEEKKSRGAPDPMLSNCAVVPDPGAYCALPAAPGAAPSPVAGACRLRPRSAGAGGAIY
jgi:hypothetical protein